MTSGLTIAQAFASTTGKRSPQWDTLSIKKLGRAATNGPASGQVGNRKASTALVQNDTTAHANRATEPVTIPCTTQSPSLVSGFAFGGEERLEKTLLIDRRSSNSIVRDDDLKRPDTYTHR
jgi:hypothetical protein